MLFVRDHLSDRLCEALGLLSVADNDDDLMVAASVELLQHAEQYPQGWELCRHQLATHIPLTEWLRRQRSRGCNIAQLCVALGLDPIHIISTRDRCLAASANDGSTELTRSAWAAIEDACAQPRPWDSVFALQR